MRRLIIILVLSICLAGAVGAYWGLLDLRHWSAPEYLNADTAPDRTSQVSRPVVKSQPKKELPAKKSPAALPPQKRNSPFDIAKVDPDGPSVFAGRAQPDGHVTVFVDGKSVGSANTDINGEWVLVTDEGIPSEDPQLTVEFKSGSSVNDGHTEANTVNPEVTEKHNSKSSSQTDQAEKATADLLSNFRQLVDRERAQQNGRIAEPSIDKTPLSSTGARVAEVGTSPVDGEAVSAADTQQETQRGLRAGNVIADLQPGHALRETSEPLKQSESIPVPIKFVFNEAVLTDDGRKTAELLVEYVMLKKYSSLELTGHADERGRHEYNLALSSERLKVVAAMLRKAGYSGELRLIPKGETEPFTGVDRSKFSTEVLHELDRRVELRETLP